MRRVIAGIRTGWCVLGVCLLMIVGVEGGLRLFFFVKDTWIDGPAVLPIDPRASTEIYADQPWAVDYFRENRQVRMARWHSYVYWRHAPFEGAYINIDEQGIRRTWTDPQLREDADAPLIYVFGGSTVWGEGARDDHTVPSCLAKLLAERGERARVVNFGQSGYVSTQEVIALMRSLQRGETPDLVIFYDGFNDVTSSYFSRQAGLPQNEPNRVAEFNLLRDPERVGALYRKQQASADEAVGPKPDRRRVSQPAGAGPAASIHGAHGGKRRRRRQRRGRCDA